MNINKWQKTCPRLTAQCQKSNEAILQWQQAKTNDNRAENQFYICTSVLLSSAAMIPLARNRLLATLSPLLMLPIWFKTTEKSSRRIVELRDAQRIMDDELQNFVQAKTHANNVLQQASSNIMEACQQQTNTTKAKLVPAIDDLGYDTEHMWRNVAQEMISELNDVDATINVVREQREDIFHPGTDFIRSILTKHPCTYNGPDRATMTKFWHWHKKSKMQPNKIFLGV